MIIAFGDVDAEDFQHRIREVGIPAAGAKAHLTEHLAVAEAQLCKGRGARHEIIEGALVPFLDQRIPDRLDGSHISVADACCSAE